MALSDKRSEIIAPLLLAGISISGFKGRPRNNNREVQEGILWILRAGAR